MSKDTERYRRNINIGLATQALRELTIPETVPFDATPPTLSEAVQYLYRLDLSNILTREIHQASNIGCARLTQDFPLISLQDYQLNNTNKITGNAANELTIRHAEYPVATLTESMQDNMRIYLNQDARFNPGDILIISDCQRAEIFKAQVIRRTNGKLEITSSFPLHDKYQKYSEVSRLSINKFYVAKTNRRNKDGSDIYALYAEDIHHRKSELVMGVNQMQLKFTVENGGGMVEVPPSQVADWAKVLGVAVEVELHAPPLKRIWYVYSTL